MRRPRLLVIGACSCIGALGTAVAHDQQIDDSATRIVREWRNTAGPAEVQPAAVEPGVSANDNGMTAPVFCDGDSAELPPEAAIVGVNARPLILVAVRTDGSVQPIRPLSQAGFGFEENAIRAVKRYRFLPGQYDDKPVLLMAFQTLWAKPIPTLCCLFENSGPGVFGRQQ